MRHWRGGGDLVHEHHPVVAVAERRSEELADGLLYLKSLAAPSAADAGEGLVLLDTGGFFDQEVVHRAVRACLAGPP